MNVTVADKNIELHARPKHRAVMQVQNLMTEWLMDNIDLSGLDPSTGIQTALQQALIRDPALALNVSQMQQTLVMDQTIMLATGMGYRELETLKDDLYEDEYQTLYTAAQDAIGGKASDFFGKYTSGSFLSPAMKNQEISSSGISENRPGNTSETLTGHLTEKTSTSQD